VSALHELLAIIAPPVCAACGAQTGADRLVCGECLRDLPWIEGCPRCALPSHRGRACPGWDMPFDSAWAPLAYEGVARDLVGALKFRGALPLAGLMAAQMTADAPTFPDGAVVVPVPPSRVRLRRRGFDPAGLLARAFAERTGLRLQTVLRRSDRAGRQTQATRSQRSTRAIAVEARSAPAVALLVDDVHTTGATLRACAAALKLAGSERVHALTYARTL
jgi:predicted amidophosphoribosyltransferase